MLKNFTAQKEHIKKMHVITEEQFQEAHKQSISSLLEEFLETHLKNAEVLKQGGEKAHRILFNYISDLVSIINICPSIVVLTQNIIDQYLKILTTNCVVIAKANEGGNHAELHKASSQTKTGSG